MNHKAKKRAALFDRYLAAFNAIYPDRTDRLPCVLCMETWFTRDDAVSGETVTLEHVPPNQTGGRALCLTCMTCNSGFGFSADAQLIGLERQRKALAGEGGAQNFIYTKIDGVPAKWRRETPDGGMLLEVLSPHLPHRDHLWKRLTEDGCFNLSFRLPNPSQVRVGRVKSAFLVMLAKLGFSYVLNERLFNIRRQLKAPKDDVFYVPTIGWSPSDVFGDCIIQVRTPFDGILVSVAGTGVILPMIGPDSPADDQLYGQLAAQYERNDDVAICGTPVPWPASPECGLDHYEGVSVSWPEDFHPPKSTATDSHPG